MERHKTNILKIHWNIVVSKGKLCYVLFDNKEFDIFKGMKGEAELSKKTAIILGNFIVLLLTVLLFTLGSFQSFSNTIYSYISKWSMTGMPHEDIIVIGIDEKSLQDYGAYPFDRKLYGKLVNIMEESGAKVIAFDVMFNNSSNPESDKAFADDLAKYKNVIIPSVAVLENQFSRSTKVKADERIMAHDVTKPIDVLGKVSQTAHINALFDDDGVIRKTWLELDTADGVLPSLGLKIAQMVGTDVDKYLVNNPQKELTINYQAMTKDFFTISFSKVLSGTLPKDTFKDRIVLIGYVAPGSDQGITPIEKHMNLVYAHANIVSQLLSGQNVTYLNQWTTIGIMFVAILLFAFASWRIKPFLTLAGIFALTLGILFLQYQLFATKGLFIDSVNPLVAIYLTFVVNIATKTFYETKQKNFITKQFGRYISPELVKQIAASNQELQLGGMNKDLSILFLDIRGFTALSEKLKPEEVVDFLNTMFDVITSVTLQNKGTVDKFIGDAAMLIFNAPLDVENHEYYAVKTGYDIQQAMVGVREEIEKKHGITVNVGIGINSGNVVVGNIGSYLRVDYTVIGDNVNTAARIESSTTAGQILVSEQTYLKTHQYIEYTYAGEKLFKNKSIPTKLYEVIGITNPL